MSTPVRLALLDYGAGNLASVQKALAHVGFDVIRATSAADAADARALVIPGVGHFSATEALMCEFRRTVMDAVDAGMPVLGICLGLQVLFEGSEEAPGIPGFAFLQGRCFRLSGGVKVPHVGWNSMTATHESYLLRGVAGGNVYFTHSFAAPVTDAAAAVTTHGVPFASVVERGMLCGVQWHPEKSGDPGLALLRNFRELCESC